MAHGKNGNFKIIGWFALSLFSITMACAQQRIRLSSPDKNITAFISISEEHQLSYTLYNKTNMVIMPSKLGLNLNDQRFGSNVSSMTIVSDKKENKQYRIVGKHTFATQNCRSYNLAINEAGKTYLLSFKLFNDGFAYRYQFPGNPVNHVNEELSSFTLPVGSRVWFFERNNSWKLKSYAGEWISAPIDSMTTISKQGPVQGKPLVVKLRSGGYAAITEAALYNYSGMRLEAKGDRSFQVNFTEGTKGFDIEDKVISPWRVIICAGNLNQLVNSDIITNLNPPPAKGLYKDQKYIRPGRSVWSWITKDSTYLHPEKEKQFIDNASKLSFEYTLIDDGWEKQWPDKWQQLKALCDYAKTKRVGVWVWKNSSELRDDKTIEAFFDSVAGSGAVGLKVDFMNSESKTTIDFDINLLKEAAARKLMMVLHGCQAPSGENRTYPNELNREGIRGMELNLMQEGPVTAAHNAALPFTRFITGHGDYTPGLFSNPGGTTWGQQLACMYLFDAPFMCMAENPEYLFKNQNLHQILPPLKKLPSTWDETIVLPGSEIGKIAAIAKRKGNRWYIAVINGETRVKAFKINGSFLSKGKSYKGLLINDDNGQAKQLKSTNIGNIDRGFLKTIDLQGNGGFVIEFLPQNQ